jgi:hypothetical protein
MPLRYDAVMAFGIVQLRRHFVLKHKDMIFESGYEGCPVHEGTPLQDNIIIVAREERHNETANARRSM